MRSIPLLLALFALAPAAHASSDGEPQRIKTIGSWRVHDPVAPQYPRAERWTPSDVVGFLALYPEAVMDGGYRDGYPPGNTRWRELGVLVGQARELAAARGVPFDGRMCITERPDVLSRFSIELSCAPNHGGAGCDWEGDMDGSFGESETIVKYAGTALGGSATGLVDAGAAWKPAFYRHRLLVLRPGAGEERRRVVENDATTLGVDRPWLAPPQPGDRFEIRGSFDPAWVQRVPRSDHRETLRQLWEQKRNVCGPRGSGRACRAAAQPLDPFDPANRRAWVEYVDRAAIEALATPTHVPALYGPIIDGVSNSDSPSTWLDPYFSAAAVVMDVSNPAYRAWRIKYLMYKLQDHGLAAGAPACVLLTYKPGWYAFHDARALGESADVCAVPGSNLWTGPAHVCADGSAHGGPFDAGLYGPGAFEEALNAYLREMPAALAQRGWSDLRIITTERPAYRGKIWSLLDEDVRRGPKLRGEWDRALDPLLSALRGSPPPSPPAPGPEPAPDPTPAAGPDPAPVAGAPPVPDPGAGSPPTGAGAPTAATPSGPAARTVRDLPPDRSTSKERHEAFEAMRAGRVLKSPSGGGAAATIEPPLRPRR